jgi:Uncharacterized conserved protein
MEIQGNILDHEYLIEIEGAHCRNLKKWFHIRDTYGVKTELGQNNILIQSSWRLQLHSIKWHMKT